MLKKSQPVFLILTIMLILDNCGTKSSLISPNEIFSIIIKNQFSRLWNDDEKHIKISDTKDVK